ncbi:hypothetical protein CRUP_029975 [Coryphaenoides rupestris]|nr:hypothetical protein CRUP_029975 [Coryphaenoides rupestris]
MWCKVLLLLSLLAVINSGYRGPRGHGASAVRPASPSNVSDLSLVNVTWTGSVGSQVASFGRALQQHVQEGFLWDPVAFLRGNFSLTVSEVALAHQGAYVCSFSYNSSRLVTRNVSLNVLAPPTLQVVSQWVVLERESRLECLAEGFFPPPVVFSWTREGVEIQAPHSVDGELAALTLACDLDGFYPEDLSVSWVQNGTTLPETPVSELNPDGTFRTTRYFTLTSEQRQQSGHVQCVVGQPGVLEPAQVLASLEDLDPPDTDPVLTKSAKASVALMCISLVLVFLLCFGFSWRRRDEKQKSLSVSGIILPPHVVVGQKGRVSLSIEGRRVDRVQTSWFLNDMPIADTSRTGTSKTNFNCLYNTLTTIQLPYGLTLTSPVSEKGPLLPPRGQVGYYKLHNQGPLHSTGNQQQLVSSLTFVPQISVHKGAVFKCQVSYMGKDKVVVERISERFTVLAAPEVSEIQLAEATQDSDVITMTVHASHFHPDVITFRWFCEGSELSPVASQASSSPRPDPQGFFCASSQCRLRRGELERGNTKVWVSVHHVALKHPVTRETRGFYPPNLTVTWLCLREGEQDDREEEVVEGGEVWGPIQTQARLYRATAILHPARRREEAKERGGGGKGGGVVCRVEHCSLDQPIERRWRNAQLAPPSVPLSMSVCWSNEGVGVFSLLLRGGQPRARLLWTAGGATLSPLTSSETEEMGDDGQRELRSVCALQRASAGKETSAPKTPEARTRGGRAINGKTAVTDPDIEGIQYIDEKLGGENNNNDMQSWEVMKTLSEEEEEESDDVESGDSDEEEVAPGGLHINRVDVRAAPRQAREGLRVCVEITHPALTLPVYRTWTERLLDWVKQGCLFPITGRGSASTGRLLGSRGDRKLEHTVPRTEGCDDVM